jgi:hypothetical protein
VDHDLDRRGGCRRATRQVLLGHRDDRVGAPQDAGGVPAETSVESHARCIFRTLAGRVPQCRTVAAADPLELGGRRTLGHLEQRLLGRRSRHARERPDLRVADSALTERVVDER